MLLYKTIILLIYFRNGNLAQRTMK